MISLEIRPILVIFALVICGKDLIVGSVVVEVLVGELEVKAVPLKCRSLVWATG
jgi:hypothetical protein